MEIEELLVVCIMPFLYGAATRLPFIYFVIHLVDNFKVDMLWVGIYVTFYQASRVVTSAFAIVCPKISHFLGTAIGLAGFLTVYLSDNGLLTPFVVGTAVVGFSETMSSMQKYAKKMFQLEPDREMASKKLRYQYASVMLGVVFAFSIGGFVYQYYFINGVALFGVIIQSLGLASFFLYLSLSTRGTSSSSPLVSNEKNKADSCKLASFLTQSISTLSLIGSENEKEKKDKTNTNAVVVNNTEEENDKKQINIASSASSSNNSTRSSIISFVNRIRGSLLTRTVNEANSKFDTDTEIATTWINWIVCISFGIEALTIGYNLSIGPIFLLDEFNKQTSIIGIMFAVGAASGTFAAVSVTCTDLGKDVLKKIATSPFDVCFAMLGIGLGVLVAAVPSFPVHVLGVVILMCFNDLGATLMTELQASISTTSNYSLLGPMGQVVRRTLNCVTALTGPILFGMYPRLPYIVAGTVTLVWTTLL